ncbi:MAG: hypothetical protein OXS30_11500 [Chloroflexota bacterium]|nr:hypothetical protein [Chloroflexota bacterium]
MLTTESVRTTLKQTDLHSEYPGDSLGRLVQLANRELREWGHSEHQVTVERITPYFGDPDVLRWSFWCETCHVSHHALMNSSFSRSQAEAGSAPGSTDAEPRSKRRWTLGPAAPRLKQRILG